MENKLKSIEEIQSHVDKVEACMMVLMELKDITFNSVFEEFSKTATLKVCTLERIVADVFGRDRTKTQLVKYYIYLFKITGVEKVKAECLNWIDKNCFTQQIDIKRFVHDTSLIKVYVHHSRFHGHDKNGKQQFFGIQFFNFPNKTDNSIYIQKADTASIKKNNKAAKRGGLVFIKVIRAKELPDTYKVDMSGLVIEEVKKTKTAEQQKMSEFDYIRIVKNMYAKQENLIREKLTAYKVKQFKKANQRVAEQYLTEGKSWMKEKKLVESFIMQMAS